MKVALRQRAIQPLHEKTNFTKRDCVATGDLGRPKAAGPCLVLLYIIHSLDCMIVLQMFASSPGPWLSLSTGVSDTTVVVRSSFTTFKIRTLVSTFFHKILKIFM